MTAIPDKEWMAVPARVCELYVKHAGDAKDIISGKITVPLIIAACGPVVLHKEAGTAFTQIGKGWNTANKALGGPNALTNALLGGALTAGAGYGSGWLLEKLFPQKYMKRGPLKRNLALAGGLAGSLGAGYLHGKPLVQEHGVKGLLMPAPPDKVAEDTFLQRASKQLQVEFEEDALYKHAYDSMSGIMLPQIPKDEFNQMILRDPYTSMAIRAGTLGLTEAASQSRGGATMISPMDVGRIAVGMGSGAVSGMLVGKVLGALAGLTPKGQEGLQRGGIMAGLLANIIPKAFGG